MPRLRTICWAAIAASLLLHTPGVIAATHDVGVIRDLSTACPPGSEEIVISTDDEDNNNISEVSGWTGAITRYSTGTTFHFCRVDGDLFHSLPSHDYVVLQLGSSCPVGSTQIFRVFDNQNYNNNNYSVGDIAPNDAHHGTNTLLYFCFFPAGSGVLLQKLPFLRVPYGVFAAPTAGAPWLDTGYAFLDDEDTNNTSYTYANVPTPYVARFAQIIYGTDSPTQGRNSVLRTAKAQDGTCHAPWCPVPGSWYDGANCFVAAPPAGTTGFVWSGNLYYTPVSGNQCPLSGSWYDGANCFVATPPPGTFSFVWSGNLYHSPLCQ